MDWLEIKYLMLLSVRLRNFKKKSANLYNFSCILCGDSSTDKKKARAYVYSRSGKTFMTCHNCSTTMTLSNFIKRVDHNLYNDMLLEKYNEEKSKEQVELEKFVEKLRTPLYMKTGPLAGLKKVSRLSPDDPIKQFVVSRKIPNPYHIKLFKCPKFFTWTNTILPDKFDEKAELYDECRLLIPFIDKNEMVHAYQGRSLDKNSKTRYITIVTDETKPKLWGMDDIDFNRRFCVLEGPLDAMFVPNAIATAGGDLVTAVRDIPRDNMVVVYDNERRSHETRHKMERAVLQGYKICVWPRNFEHKDINDAVIAGLSPEFIKYIIDQNTHKDLNAQLAINDWSLVK